MTNDLTLREIAQSILDRHQVSGRQLNQLASQKGLTLSYTTVNHLAAGTYKSRPSKKTLNALVALSDYTAEQVYAAAGEPLPSRPFSEDLPPDVDLLTPSQRLAVIGVVRQFTSMNRELAQSTQRQPAQESMPERPVYDDEIEPPTEDEYGLAAKRAPRERAFDDQTPEGDE